MIMLFSFQSVHHFQDYNFNKEDAAVKIKNHKHIKHKTIPRIAMKFAINRKLKLHIAKETMISLLFTLDQY